MTIIINFMFDLTLTAFRFDFFISQEEFHCQNIITKRNNNTLLSSTKTRFSYAKLHSSHTLFVLQTAYETGRRLLGGKIKNYIYQVAIRN